MFAIFKHKVHTCFFLKQNISNIVDYSFFVCCWLKINYDRISIKTVNDNFQNFLVKVIDSSIAEH